MSVIYFEEDANPNLLTERVIGVIGYAQPSRIAAMNLHHKGLRVLVGCSEAERASAQADGLPSGSIDSIVSKADILLIPLSTEDITDIYMSQIAPSLRRGHTLLFTSAYCIAFGFIEPPPFVDVGVIAPRTIDGTLTEAFTTQTAASSFVAVWQDASRQAWDTVLAMAASLGALKHGAVEVSVEQEAELSLFVEQVLMPVFYHVMLAAFRLTIKNGYPLEAALIDLYIQGKFAHYMEQASSQGLLEVIEQLSKPTQFGMLSRLDRFQDLKLERLMEITLEEIHSGNFAREWVREHADGHPRLRKILEQQKTLDLWELEQQTLDMLDRR